MGSFQRMARLFDRANRGNNFPGTREPVPWTTILPIEHGATGYTERMVMRNAEFGMRNKNSSEFSVSSSNPDRRRKRVDRGEWLLFDFLLPPLDFRLLSSYMTAMRSAYFGMRNEHPGKTDVEIS